MARPDWLPLGRSDCDRKRHLGWPAPSEPTANDDRFIDSTVTHVYTFCESSR